MQGNTSEVPKAAKTSASHPAREHSADQEQAHSTLAVSNDTFINVSYWIRVNNKGKQ